MEIYLYISEKKVSKAAYNMQVYFWGKIFSKKILKDFIYILKNSIDNTYVVNL